MAMKVRTKVNAWGQSPGMVSRISVSMTSPQASSTTTGSNSMTASQATVSLAGTVTNVGASSSTKKIDAVVSTALPQASEASNVTTRPSPWEQPEGNSTKPSGVQSLSHATTEQASTASAPP